MHRTVVARLAALFVAGAALLAVSAESGAQSSKKPIRIGVITFSERELNVHLERSLAEGFREMGYVEGVNLIIERRNADGHAERVPGIVKELAGMQLDAILTTCTPTTRAMASVPNRTPIVMAAVSDPLGQGLISSYPKPGGRITGTASQFQDLAPKLLQLLREAVPANATIGVVHNPRNPVHKIFLADIEAAARSVSATVVAFEITRTDHLDPALDGMKRANVNAVMVLPDDSFLFHLRRQIVERLTAAKLPSIFGLREAVEDGALMSYGESLRRSHFRAAHFVDKIVHGAKPEELPVEQPTRFELVVNLKAAKALGISVPTSILLRADEVIE